ncbi:MAG TPA: sulfite exporter TauE/SafE family protein [Polyangiaceae bacterium]|nr:sulfite exporter TauE/SafE family protein [Polyangiaceae bacterium]
MSPATACLLFGAAAIGGAINSVAGGGSFVAFPALLFAGVPAIAANATTTVALCPGTIASAVAYRRELREVRGELLPLSIAGFVGGLAGSLLLLRTSDRTFVLLIPWLLLFAASLFSFGGSLTKSFATSAHRTSVGAAAVIQLAISVYGGYFGGGLGIMTLAVLSLLGMADIHRMNALKTVISSLVNGVAVVAFVWAGAVRWGPGVVMIAGGSLGGYAGAAWARRVDPRLVRRLVLVVAWGMTAYFFAKTFWGVLGPLSRFARACGPFG